MAFKDFYRNSNLQLPSSQTLKMMTTIKLKSKRKTREEKILTFLFSVPSCPFTKKRNVSPMQSLVTKQWAMIVQLGLLSAAPKKSEGKKIPPKNSGSIDK